MDISTFLGGNFLSSTDLPQNEQTWTIAKVDQQTVGEVNKVCITFAEFPSKPLGCNKCNLRSVASGYGTNAAGWLGRPLVVRRESTQFQGRVVPCVRVYVPQQPPAAVPPATPQQQQAPVAPPPVQAPDVPWGGA